jgi:hypothetical protein
MTDPAWINAALVAAVVGRSRSEGPILPSPISFCCTTRIRAITASSCSLVQDQTTSSSL